MRLVLLRLAGVRAKRVRLFVRKVSVDRVLLCREPVSVWHRPGNTVHRRVRRQGVGGRPRVSSLPDGCWDAAGMHVFRRRRERVDRLRRDVPQHLRGRDHCVRRFDVRRRTSVLLQHFGRRPFLRVAERLVDGPGTEMPESESGDEHRMRQPGRLSLGNDVLRGWFSQPVFQRDDVFWRLAYLP